MHNSITIQIVLTSFLWTCFSASTIAQSPQEKNPMARKQGFVSKDRVQALRIAFYVEELELTAEESEKFWPIQQAAQQLFKDHGDLIRAMEDSLHASRWPVSQSVQQVLSDNGDPIRIKIENLDSSSLDSLHLKEQNGLLMFDELNELHHQGIDLRSDYIKEALGVLGYQRALKLPVIERNFRKKILKRKIGMDNMPPPPPRH
ncbi:MAG: hypothetical protein CL834_06035 [Crocinitomicaceae bacterium]|nr:hypothetical protein [Crocinitomicaceae bacterium]